MRIPLTIPPGLDSDDTSFAASGRWADGANVRFWRGQAQVIGGWERLMGEPLSGVCRRVLAWTDHGGGLQLAFGTHTDLQVLGGGVLSRITPVGLEAGPVDGAGGRGFGTGTYSSGAYSTPSLSDYFPRTWSLSAWGEALIASPRGGAIYLWDNDPNQRAKLLAAAPGRVSAMLVSATDQVFALGCEEEVSRQFNPLCIRHSSIRDAEVWATRADTTAREYILPGGGRIVGACNIGSGMLVWTDHALFLGSFVGALNQPWRFDRIGEQCGLIGPNAATVVGQTAYWLGPDYQFRRCIAGGEPEVLVCPIAQDMVTHFAVSQDDKVVASTNTAFQEVRFDYPDARDGFENSRYLALSVPDGVWSRGVMARSAFIDAGPQSNPIGVSPQGDCFWHERGFSADGAPFSWFLETADNFQPGGELSLVRGIWPDIGDQIGPVSLTLVGRMTPAGTETCRTSVALPVGAEWVDLRITARLFRVRFSGDSAPTRGRLGCPVFDIVATGRR